MVADSIFARVIVLDNGGTKVAVVGLDLLITPPTVMEALKKRLPEVGLRWENVYTGAIHSHNSIGGWAPGLVGQLIAGGYDEKIVSLITDGILKAIQKAQTTMAPVQVGFGETDASDHIYNRIGNSGPTRPLDGMIRLLKLKKNTGESALLCTFAGHATLYEDDMWNYLSRDYPGSLVDRLEKKSADFAVFMAGPLAAQALRREAKQIFRKFVITRVIWPFVSSEPYPKFRPNPTAPWLCSRCHWVCASRIHA
ncbi:neutral/alkaline non-lysosomal ceramidase N-terminal domain-containing protein [Spirosoma telluris]|uniref:neutral/alkaline non-lysosomal ceramidase N-terminal domain-containing protein n=1 Tax=Spirosoma telluris TaxID=2183553 RepID=UPI002FC2AD15